MLSIIVGENYSYFIPTTTNTNYSDTFTRGIEINHYNNSNEVENLGNDDNKIVAASTNEIAETTPLSPSSSVVASSETATNKTIPPKGQMDDCTIHMVVVDQQQQKK